MYASHFVGDKPAGPTFVSPFSGLKKPGLKGPVFQ
jgi:hypothetical protein